MSKLIQYTERGPVQAGEGSAPACTYCGELYPPTEPEQIATTAQAFVINEIEYRLAENQDVYTCVRCGLRSYKPASEAEVVDPPAWALGQDPERCEACGTLLTDAGCSYCDEQYGGCKTCPLPPEACAGCGLGGRDDYDYDSRFSEARSREGESGAQAEEERCLYCGWPLLRGSCPSCEDEEGAER